MKSGLTGWAQINGRDEALNTPAFSVDSDDFFFPSKYEDNEIKLGTEFTVKSANEGFVSWTNESGKVLSKQPEYTFKVLGDTVINMNCADYVRVRYLPLSQFTAYEETLN